MGTTEMGDCCLSRVIKVSSCCHRDVLVQGLWNFFRSKRGTDFDCRWGGRLVPAHRIILEVFLRPEKLAEKCSGRQDVPGVKGYTPDKDLEEEERLDGTGNGNLDLLLEFLYTGEVAVPEERLDGLLRLARELDFEMLLDATHSPPMMEDGSVADDFFLLEEEKHYPDFPAIAEEGFSLPPIQLDVAGSCYGNPDRQAENSYSSEQMHNDGEHMELFLEPIVELLETKAEASKALISLQKQQERQSYKSVLDFKSSFYDWDTLLGQMIAKPLENIEPVIAKEPSEFRQQNGLARQSDTDDSNDFFNPDGYSDSDDSEDSSEDLKPKSSHARKTAKSENFNRPRQSDKLCASTWSTGTEAIKVETDNKRVNVCCLPVTKVEPDKNGIKSIRCDQSGAKVHPMAKIQPKKRKRRVTKKYGLEVAKVPPDTKKKVAEECEKSVNVDLGGGGGDSSRSCFKCPHCSRGFSFMVNLDRHVSILHTNVKAPNSSRFTCEACGLQCHSRGHLTRHTMIHTKERPFKCSDCSYAAAQESALKTHVEALHAKGYTRFSCPKCGKKCGSRSKLDDHLQVDHQPIKCPSCDLVFSFDSDLELHQRALHIT